MYIWVVIQYHTIYFLTQNFPSLATESSFSWLLCLFDMFPSLYLFFKYFLTFWHNKMPQS